MKVRQFPEIMDKFYTMDSKPWIRRLNLSAVRHLRTGNALSVMTALQTIPGKSFRIGRERTENRTNRNEKNLRLAATLNKCLKLASGEYIARMDDDGSLLSGAV